MFIIIIITSELIINLLSADNDVVC